MKFVHLSDLHIGIRVNEFSMLEDQKYIFLKILNELDRIQPDGVILAGDIYDKPVPSGEAVQVFDLFLTRIAAKNIPVFMISGNHDSPERVSFGAHLLKNSKIYVAPVFNGEFDPITLKDEFGEVDVYMLPFIKPANVKQFYPEESIVSYQDGVACVIKPIGEDEKLNLEISDKTKNNRRRILIAHQFVTGAKRSDSEDISVGGVDNIDAKIFENFDYVALGHIHKPQWILRETVRYCGTPLKYSFSEANHEKSITLVELCEKGNIKLEFIPLISQKDLREIKGTYMEITAKNNYENTNTQDYLHITLTDEEDIPDAIGKLRSIYPYIMKLDYDNMRTRTMHDIEGAQDVEKKTSLEHFSDFYKLQNNNEMSMEQMDFVTKLFEDMKEDER